MTIDHFADHLSAPCPHPDCRHQIKIRPDLPADTYLCPCHAITVRLAWDSYVGGPRQPRLSRQETR